MAAFLRGKQAGMPKDLSAAILPGSFIPEEQIRYGINSQISCLAYEPIQSLLAVGTTQSKFGPGKIYVFGHKRIHKVLTPTRPCSFRQLHFVADRLVSLDAKSEMALWNLDQATRVAAFSNPGGAAYMLTDPVLDWVFLGRPNGDLSAYDLDCERPAPFRIPNLWTQRNPRARTATLVSMQLHPRDIGQLLIAYSTGAVVYSFKQNAPVHFFEYQLPPGAPGANADDMHVVRKPGLTHAVWHPTGTFILTAHDDGSLVFWDPKDGRLVTARSLYATRVQEPATPPPTPARMDPFLRISWCCKQNPDDTGLLIAGGQRVQESEKGLTWIELGPTPIYATSSWDVLAKYCQGKQPCTLPTPPGAQVRDYCLVPRMSPHFAGAQDPIAILVMLSSGEVMPMSFPSGYPISPTNQLHPSLSLVAPFVTKMAVTTIDPPRWLAMQEKRQTGDLLLQGGAQGSYPRRRRQGRNIVQVAHADSTIRIWDLGHADDLENPHQLQVDMARAVHRYENVNVTAMALAEATGEFAAGTSAGEVVVYRWGANRSVGRDEPPSLEPNPGGLSDIVSRAEPSLAEGLQPFVLYDMSQGPISALTASNVGFVGVGSEGGFFSLLDLRGPSVLFHASLAEYTHKQEKKPSFLKSHATSPSLKPWPVVIEFAVMTLQDDPYSSIACFVGTNLGHVLTLKLLPSGQGQGQGQGPSYTVQFVGLTHCTGKVISISPIVSDTGRPASATGDLVAGLRNGHKVNGTLVVVTDQEARIFKPATHKGASKSFGNVLCHAAAVTDASGDGFALVALFGDGTARAYSIPGLKELGHRPLPMLDPTRTTAAMVARTGDVVGWTGPAEFTVIPCWGTGADPRNTDSLINPALTVPPPRPTISNLQWISGTQYMSPTDLDLLVGGPDRPPSKRVLAATAHEDRLARPGGAGDAAAAAAHDEGWADYLTRQLHERSEKLAAVGDQMDKLESQTASWADDVSKYVHKQKRSMLLGGLTKGLF